MNFRIHQGDALKVLRTMEASSVHCCITSPPFWGLRDYGTACWEGGAADCDHSYNHGVQGSSGDRADRTFTAQAVYKDVCRKCGAKRVDEQIGLEPTPEAYVAKLVEVFADVRRILRNDGTLWLNLGDSYATGAGKVGDHPGGGEQGARWVGRDDAKGRGTPKRADGSGGHNYVGPMTQPNRLPIPGLKPKDLCGIPWRVAFALQAAGWWLRSDIIWAKPAPMPESVTDRPTRSHEYIFLLAKSEKYYYDHEAIKEPCAESQRGRIRADAVGGTNWVGRNQHSAGGLYKPRPSAAKGSFNGKTEAMSETGQNAFRAVTEMRNRRDVWFVDTQPFPEAHFATFPPKLIEPCVIAGCPAGGTILDPFAGAGTTGLVAKKHNRSFVGIELNPEYIKMAQKRLAQDVLDFSEAASQ